MAPPRLLAVSIIGPMRLGALVEGLVVVGVAAAIARRSGTENRLAAGA